MSHKPGSSILPVPSMTCAPAAVGWPLSASTLTMSLAANGDALLAGTDFAVVGIKDRNVLDDEVACGMMNELLGQAGCAGRFNLILRLSASVPNVLS